jgi:DNA-binding transcriptional regulator YiaG
MNVSTPVIAAQLGVDRRTVSRWVAGDARKRGPQPRPDLHDQKIRELRDQGLSYAETGRRLGVPWTTVRNRWYAINGRQRPR